MRKNKWMKQELCILLGAALALTGCGHIAASNEQESSEAIVISETTTESENADDTEQNTDVGETATGENPKKPAYEGTAYTWKDITVTVPDAWKDKYIIQEFENGKGFSFIQKASNDKEEGMGYLCGFAVSDGPTFELAGERQLAYTSDQMYYMSTPTDVSFFYEDDAIASEYQEMSHYVIDMGESIQIAKENVHYNPREYAIPMSDCYALPDDVATLFNDNELWIARNEIFARHGREFENPYLQEHFDACSWYEGTTPAEQFDDSMLTDVEKQNLALIEKGEADYQESHPYPKKEPQGTESKYDLDEDGTKETLSYQVTKVSKGDYEEYEGHLTIAGKDYNLGDYEVSMENPETDKYYITDISPYFPGLEIAVMDYGPSDDLVTHFFTYDSTKNGKEALHYIGAVGGFPFKEENGVDGFADEGCVKGVIRTDIINTCYGYASWWYDYDNQKLTYQETGYYPMLPSGAHELYVDLPVYSEMNTDSVRSTIPAQKETYFTLTDGKEWIQVKGKDGSHGFVHIKSDETIDGLDKKGEEVFSNLQFYD